MLTFGNKFNRSYSMYLPFMGEHCEITLLFNKANSNVGFNLDSNHYKMSRNNEIHCNTYQNLEKSEFAASFLDIRNYKSKNLDIKQQFYNILPEFKDNIHYETNETVKVSKVKTHRGSFDSCAYVYVFRYTDFRDDFLYVLVERQHIDIILDKKVVRTSAYQICTNEVFEDLASIVENTNRKYVAENTTIDAGFRDVFSSKSPINKDQFN